MAALFRRVGGRLYVDVNNLVTTGAVGMPMGRGPPRANGYEGRTPEMFKKGITLQSSCAHAEKRLVGRQLFCLRFALIISQVLRLGSVPRQG